MDKYISLDAAVEAVWKSQWMTDFEKGVIQKLLHKLPTVEMGWIPVTERVPEENDKYLCNIKSYAFPGSSYLNILRYDKDGFHDGGIYEDGVTHWMPLPEPPGKDVSE